ncbi:MAG: GatB/YqeY domain-containing protein [Vicinamibacterales bacterium]
MGMLEDTERGIAAAMKARDQTRLGTLRLLKTALTNRSIEKGGALDERESLQVVTSLVKQRRDSIDQFGRAGRQDLVDKEQAELAILDELLPAPVSAADLDAHVEAAVAETGAASVKDLGRVMKAVMARLQGAAVDGKVVNELVRKRLSN